VPAVKKSHPTLYADIAGAFAVERAEAFAKTPPGMVAYRRTVAKDHGRRAMRQHWVLRDPVLLAYRMIAGVGGNRGSDLTQVGDRLTRDQMTWRILGGGHNMPAFGGNISPQDLQDVLTFLQLLK